MLNTNKGRKASAVLLAVALAGGATAAHAGTVAPTKGPATDIPTVSANSAPVLDFAAAQNAGTLPVISVTGSGLLRLRRERQPGLSRSSSSAASRSPLPTCSSSPTAAWSSASRAHRRHLRRRYCPFSGAGVAKGVDGTIDTADDELLATGPNDIVVSNSVGTALDFAADDVNVVDPTLVASGATVSLVDGTNKTVSASHGSMAGGSTLYLLAPVGKIQKATKVAFDTAGANVAGTITKRTTVKYTNGASYPLATSAPTTSSR